MIRSVSTVSQTSSAQVLFDVEWHSPGQYGPTREFSHSETSKYTISSRLVRVEIRLGERIDNGSIVYKTWRIYRIELSKGLEVSFLMPARPDTQ